MIDNFRKKKQYGQNFLTNPAIPARIAAESGITDADGVIEIGPGFGILTKELSKIAKKVVAVEIDSQLIPILDKNLAEYKNAKVINADILDVDISKLMAEEFDGMSVCVCANLPYYITSEIIMTLLEGGHGFKTVTVMVQKEVADRFCSKCGSDNYGAITAVIDYYATVKRLFTVKAGCFSPKPKVDSAVIRFDIRQEPTVFPVDKKLFFSVIKAAFGQRRKTLVNAIHSAFPSASKQDIASCITACGYRDDIRGEQLDIKAFSDISDQLKKFL